SRAGRVGGRDDQFGELVDQGALVRVQAGMPDSRSAGMRPGSNREQFVRLEAGECRDGEADESNELATIHVHDSRDGISPIYRGGGQRAPCTAPWLVSRSNSTW